VSSLDKACGPQSKRAVFVHIPDKGLDSNEGEAARDANG
jgi:hypothetical protein